MSDPTKDIPQNDLELVDLFWQRNPKAIAKTQEAYGTFCYHVAYRMLNNHEDAEECVNDTWLRAWNAIPPARPVRLRPFLAKIVRNLSLDRLRAKQADKRGNGTIFVALEELSECVADSCFIEEHLQMQELEQCINRFLGQLPQRDATVFVRRYFFMDTTKAIAKQLGTSSAHVSMILSRTRKKLKQHLEQEDFL